MKGLFEAGAIIARYSDALFTEPVKPGQLLLDLPSNMIGEAIISVVASDNEYIFTVDQSSIDLQWKNIRQHRNMLLSNCDWIVSITDYNMANKNDWVAYRQALRDITKQENPFRVIWPVVPV